MDTELAGRSISVDCSLQPAPGVSFNGGLAGAFFFLDQQVSTGIKNLWDRHLTCSPLLVKMTAMTNDFFETPAALVLRLCFPIQAP